MEIIDTAKISDDAEIQLEDWRKDNEGRLPNLRGYTIGVYLSKKNKRMCEFAKDGGAYILWIGCNGRCTDYTDDRVLADYKALKNGTKKLADLREHFWFGKRDEFCLGLIDGYEKGCYF